jgi:hypothetical protein
MRNTPPRLICSPLVRVVRVFRGHIGSDALFLAPEDTPRQSGAATLIHPILSGLFVCLVGVESKGIELKESGRFGGCQRSPDHAAHLANSTKGFAMDELRLGDQKAAARGKSTTAQAVIADDQLEPHSVICRGACATPAWEVVGGSRPALSGRSLDDSPEPGGRAPGLHLRSGQTIARSGLL